MADVYDSTMVTLVENEPFRNALAVLGNMSSPPYGVVSTVPLSTVINGYFLSQAMFTQYACDRFPARAKMDYSNHANLTFTCVVVDLDSTKKSKEPYWPKWNFGLLCDYFKINYDYAPNVAYKTYRGARLIYLVDPWRGNPRDFQAKRINMLKCCLPSVFAEACVAVDSTDDWTRLFKVRNCVILTDKYRPSEIMHWPERVDDGKVMEWGGALVDEPVEFFHDGLHDLSKYGGYVPPPPRKPVVPPAGVYSAHYKIQAYISGSLEYSGRNNMLASILGVMIRHHGTVDWLVEMIRDRALEDGLSESEVDTTIKSVLAYDKGE